MILRLSWNGITLYRFFCCFQHRSFHPSYYSYFNTLHVQTGRDIDVMPFWPMRPNFCSRQSRLHVTVLLHFSLFSACHGLHVRVLLLFIIPFFLRLIVAFRQLSHMPLRCMLHYANTFHMLLRIFYLDSYLVAESL
jgi:hypothetical protein